MALVATAGPLSNLALAALVGLLFKVGLVVWPPLAARALAGPPEVLLAQFLRFTLWVNLVLAIFNLIPIAPLDGSKVVLGVVPRPLAEVLYRLEAWGPGLLITLIVVDVVLQLGILLRTLGTAVNFLALAFAGHRLF
mgnify:CR=1 FL=1